ncbi:uncharacterized protein TNIN_434771 [Trichonephila inaurata madagascariensis]|uniref:Uncharacterized protein n=1 Tax=Trichonephila inaurata madagascariensis TaxID=2747483 RepID=A0A8X7CRD6_9ARAC|nr:uncharacterized protein TNIN_434771 [Trichonephila inaurata madagascariensis]
MSWIWASILISFIECIDGAFSHDCNSSESVACRREFENLKSFQERYQYTSDNQTLSEMCWKQLLALKCVNSFAEECLPEDEQAVFKTLIKGSDKFFDYFCVENSSLRKEYLRQSACLKTISSELDECTAEYVESQKLLDSSASPKTLKQRTCCIYFENIRCSSNATSEACGQEAGELVSELWRLLGGTYLNQLCEPYSEYDSESCTPASKSIRLTPRTNILGVLFPFLFGAASRYLRQEG